jgi:hypothetical protein
MRGHWPNVEKSQQVCGRILVLGCVFFIAIIQSGCAGLLVNIPAECKNETPRIDIHDFNFNRSKLEQRVPDKELFLNYWGKPDEINSTSENEETWIYNRKLWCGVIPAFIVAVPLILPVCDGFDRLEFHGNEAKNLHTKHIVTDGFLLVAGSWVGGIEPDCRLPLPPNNGVDSDATKPTEQVTPQPKERGDSEQRIEKSLQPNLK